VASLLSLHLLLEDVLAALLVKTLVFGSTDAAKGATFCISSFLLGTHHFVLLHLLHPFGLSLDDTFRSNFESDRSLGETGKKVNKLFVGFAIGEVGGFSEILWRDAELSQSSVEGFEVVSLEKNILGSSVEFCN